MPDTDVIDLLKKDHREVERIFAKLESDATPEEEKARLLRQVADELVAHSKGEEDVVYPDVRAAAPGEGEDVKDGVAEHHHVEELLVQLLAMEIDDPGADGILAAVVAEVRHHVEEEEQDILPAYRKATSAEQRAQIGARFLQRKQQELAARGAPPPTSREALIDLTVDELYERAKEAGVPGRSDMTKDELIKALQG
jgi:Hemerythrin HHE cation binding domain/Rho termination factor, N-terminal domain